jgi:CysZ protein
VRKRLRKPAHYFLQRSEPRLIARRITSLIYGLSLPVRAGRLIVSHPVLIAWSTLPVALTCVLYYYLLRSINAEVETFILGHVSTASWLLVLMAKVVILIVAALTFSFLASLAATPFNDFLAESSERWASAGHQPLLPLPAFPSAGIFSGYWRNKVRLIGIDLLKTAASLAMGIVALFCSWIPGLNLIALALSFLILAFQFISYPQTRRGQSVGDAVHFLFRHFFACFGFGAAVLLLFSIPFVSIFSLPLAVVGGTLLVGRASSDRELR